MAEWDSGNSEPGDPAAPAGWYPVDGGMQRYWDGASWTEHTAPLAAPSAPPTVPPEAPAPWVDGAPAGQPAGDLGAVPPQPFASPGGGMSHAGFVQGGPPNPGVPPRTAPVTSDERTMALLIHLLTLVSSFIGPLILWLVKREESSFIDYHGKEALNFQISLFLYWIVTVIAMVVLIGFLLVPFLLIAQFVLPIIAAVSANQGQHYRYPLTLRVIT